MKIFKWGHYKHIKWIGKIKNLLTKWKLKWFTSPYEWWRMHLHSTRNSRTKVGLNSKYATKPFDINALTIFHFDKVPDSVIYDVSKKVINLMIILVLFMIIILLLLNLHRLRLINPSFNILEYVFLKINLHHEMKYLFRHFSDKKH